MSGYIYTPTSDSPVSTKNPLPVQTMGSKYQDAGLVVEGFNMAVGAIVYGNYIDNLEWVRNMVVFSQSDQQCDLILNRRTPSLIEDFGNTFSASQGATGSSWRSIVVSSSGNAIVGYSVRFGIKNSSASPNTFARVRVQFLGT